MMIRRILRADRWKVAAYTAVLVFNIVAVVQAYPTYKANVAAIMKMVPDWMPLVKGLMASDGGDRFAVFVALNHYFKGANVIGPAVAIILALGTIVREVEIGTIGLLLSRPISRTRILLSYAVVHLLELTLPLFAIAIATPWLTEWLIDEEVPLAPMVMAALHASAFIAAVYGFALLLAVILTEQLRLAALAGGVCIVSFLLYFVDQNLPWSIYVLSSIPMYVELAGGGPLPWGAFLACVGSAIAFLTTAVVVFKRKDY
jgi:ABC-type transport system involved in multi-copper enzyme maturation permease subunit